MKTDLINLTVKEKYIYPAAVILIILSMFDIGRDIVKFICFAGSGYLIYQSFIKRKGKDNRNEKIFSVFSAVASTLCIIVSQSFSFFPTVVTAAAFLYSERPSRFSRAVLFAAGSFLILIITDAADFPMQELLVFLFVLFSFLFLSELMSEKAAAVTLNVSLLIFCLANIMYRTSRFSYITLGDIESIGTFFSVMDKYPIHMSPAQWTVIITTILANAYVLITRKEEYQRKPLRSVLWFLMAIVVFLLTGLHCHMVSIKDRTIKTHGYEALPRSVYEELLFMSQVPAKETQMHKLDGYASDEEPLEVNIICVLCEAFADIAEDEGITLSRDPLKAFRELPAAGCKEGRVTVNIYGGGTSCSEWEQLTGLSVSTLPHGVSPLLTKVDHDYTFLNDSMYKDHKKTVIHPFYSTGWGRNKAYSIFQFDNRYFLDNWGDVPEEDTYRGLVSDKAVYQRTKEQLLSSDELQFIETITIQNHGGYMTTPEIDDLIEVDAPGKEYSELFVTYFSLLEKSSEEIAGFVKWLSEHKEKPTLLVFYGDHWPGNLDIDRTPNCYKTPYLVYSNFCDLGDMPEELPLNALFPYAKRAAGLPLTQWEKYVLSVDGNIPDKQITYSIIQYEKED